MIKIIKKNKKTEIVKAGRPRKFFTEMESMIILFGQAHERRAGVFLDEGDCKGLARDLNELRMRRLDLWKK